MNMQSHAANVFLQGVRFVFTRMFSYTFLRFYAVWYCLIWSKYVDGLAVLVRTAAVVLGCMTYLLYDENSISGTRNRDQINGVIH